MFRMIIQWLLSAITLLMVTRVVPGFYINGGMRAALIAALVIGILNATLGAVLKVITFPLAIVSFGIFLLVINAAMILLASDLVGGFYVAGWTPAFWGAVILSSLSLLIRFLAKE